MKLVEHQIQFHLLREKRDAEVYTSTESPGLGMLKYLRSIYPYGHAQVLRPLCYDKFVEFCRAIFNYKVDRTNYED